MMGMLSLLVLLNVLLVQTPQEDYKTWVQLQNVPARVQEVFHTQRLEEKYEIAFHLNPFYLRGDFDGDGRADLSILIRQKGTKKVGIAILHAEKNLLFILGAGKEFGNGGDDFSWMNVWWVYSKQEVHQGADEVSPPMLRGEAVMVEKSESASALIYWDGKKYDWYQQGD